MSDARNATAAGSVGWFAIIVTLVSLFSGCTGVEQPDHDRPAPVPTEHEETIAEHVTPTQEVVLTNPQGTLLIVHAGHLGDAAREWKEYRESRGWVVQLDAVAPVTTVNNRLSVASDIQSRIRAAFASHQPEPELPFAVLLLGDALDEQGQGVPTWHLRQHDESLRSRGDERYATDERYQFIDDDDIPDIQLGRVPARTHDEALIALEKIRRYEQDAPLGPWRRRLIFVAGEGHFGLMDRVLEGLFRSMVERVVPPDASLSLTYASPTSIYCPPPDELTNAVLHQLSSPGLLFNYIGHGHARGFDSLYWSNRRIRIFERDNLADLSSSAGPLPIGVLTCCSTGWFDLPRAELSIAEALLFHPSGPVAVIAGSRITHPYANAILQKDITELILTEEITTVGQLDLAAAHSMRELDDLDREIDSLAFPVALAGGWPSTLSELRRMHTGLYNLLGDPCTHIARFAGSISSLDFNDGVLTGMTHGLTEGTAFVSIESLPGDPARRDDLISVRGTADENLPARAAHNYPIANNHILREFQTPIAQGRFRLSMDLSELPRAAVIRVYVRGSDAEGAAADAMAAIRITASGDS